MTTLSPIVLRTENKMDTYIKYSFLIEIALIIIVLALLYIAVYFYRKKPVKSIPEMAVKEISPVEDEIISKLDRILAMIPVDYDSTLHSSDDDIKHDKRIIQQITGTEEEITTILPQRDFNTRDLFEE
mgnify:FL=1